VGYAIVFGALRHLGRRAAYLLVDIFVLPYFFLFARAARSASVAWSVRVRGPRGWWATQLGLWRHLRAFARSIVDQASVLVHGRESFEFTREGGEHLHRAYAQGAGVVLLSAHVGARALAGDAVRGLRLNIVAWEGEATAIRRVFETLRAERTSPEAQASPKVIEVNDGAFAAIDILRALRRGEVVAMLADRHRGGETVTVDFFGAPARLPKGPFLVAVLSGAPVVASFTARTAGDGVFVRASPGPGGPVDRGAREAAVRRLAAWYAAELEAFARAHPEQWFNFFDFWEPG